MAMQCVTARLPLCPISIVHARTTVVVRACNIAIVHACTIIVIHTSMNRIVNSFAKNILRACAMSTTDCRRRAITSLRPPLPTIVTCAIQATEQVVPEGELLRHALGVASQCLIRFDVLGGCGLCVLTVKWDWWDAAAHWSRFENPLALFRKSYAQCVSFSNLVKMWSPL